MEVGVGVAEEVRPSETNTFSFKQKLLKISVINSFSDLRNMAELNTKN